MRPIIDIFDETSHGTHYDVLMEAIKHLSQYKPDIIIQDYNQALEFIKFLREKMNSGNQMVEWSVLQDLAFNFEPFKKPTQKIILLRGSLTVNGAIYKGVTGGYGPDEFGNGAWRQVIALPTTETSLDQFYAVCCHELGHAYGATRYRKHALVKTATGLHCTSVGCAMHHPAYDGNTASRRKNKLPMYCSYCQTAIKNF